MLIPIGLKLGWPFELLAILLFVVIGLLLLTGQSVIFLLRLVAADRRAQGRRRPLASPTKTVGELEDEHRVAHAVVGAAPRGAEPALSPPSRPSPASRRPPSTPAARSADDEPPRRPIRADGERAARRATTAARLPTRSRPGPADAAPAADGSRSETVDQPPEEPDPGVRQ